MFSTLSDFIIPAVDYRSTLPFPDRVKSSELPFISYVGSDSSTGKGNVSFRMAYPG